jgi:hypothetical protein
MVVNEQTADVEDVEELAEVAALELAVLPAPVVAKTLMAAMMVAAAVLVHAVWANPVALVTVVTSWDVQPGVFMAKTRAFCKALTVGEDAKAPLVPAKE